MLKEYKVTLFGLGAIFAISLIMILYLITRNDPCPNGCENGLCNEDTGQCHCNNGWKGRDCSITCPDKCSGHGECGVDGVCICDSEWAGDNCSAKALPCLACINGKCDKLTGHCICDDGWDGKGCLTVKTRL